MNNYIFDGETDSESYSSWDETDNESDYGEITYEPEENTLTKYNIVLCEKYNELRHGVSNDNLNNHYLTLIRFKILDINIINALLNNSNNNLEIAECIYLPSQHCISIIKTFWLKIIQKTWKKIYKERKLCILRRSNPNAQKYKEIHGHWPSQCTNYPQLKGMLSRLSRRSSRTST